MTAASARPVIIDLVAWVGPPCVVDELAAAEQVIDKELRRWTAQAGAWSAYAAADGAFLPSLADFLG